MGKTSNLPINTSYHKLREFYTNEEFNKRFYNRLFTDLKKYVGEDLATSYFKSIDKRIGIVNKETFYLAQVPIKEDIGLRAFKKYGDNLLEFCQEVLVNMQKEKDLGKSEIDLTTVFLILSHFKSSYQEQFGKKIDKNRLETVVKSIVASAISSKNNPFKIQILPPKLFDKVIEKIGIGNGKGYLYIISDMFEVLSIYKNKKDSCLPRLEIVLPIYSDLRNNQIKFLSEIFCRNLKKTRELLEDIPNLSERSPQLMIALEQLNNTRKLLDLSTEGVMLELERMGEECKFISYNGTHESYDFLNVRYGLKRTFVKDFNIETLYVEEDSFLSGCYQQFSKMRVNCSNLDIEQIERYANVAAELSMLRLRNVTSDYSSLGVSIEPIVTIELGEIKEISVEGINALKEIEKKIKSKYNREVVLTLFFNSQAATEKYGNQKSEYIRIISDIHADVNEERNYIFNFGNDYVINCGDTSGGYKVTKNWIRNYIRKGISVAGNHMGYDMYDKTLDIMDPKNTKNIQTSFLMDTFKYHPNVHFINNEVVEYEGILFIGTTLYTDFKLFGEKNQIGCMVEARKYMNDFRRCTFVKYNKAKEGHEVKYFSPEDHAQLFKYCYGYLEGTLKKLRNKGNKKPIVIISHHAPTPYSVSEEYKNDPLSAAFASDLREFILKYPEIRLWCHGHTHSCFDYIYDKTRIICEPFGYFNENNFNIKEYGKRVSIKDIKSKKSWEQILKDDIIEGRVKVEG